MTFDQIPPGSSIVVDANILVYYFSPDPSFGFACAKLVSRIRKSEVIAVTPSSALADALHRIMLFEIMLTNNFTPSGLVRRLKRRPELVKTANQLTRVLEEIEAIGVRILRVTRELLSVAAGRSQETGLLMGDATLVAVMQQENITNIASHDADFDRVPGIVRYSPA